MRSIRMFTIPPTWKFTLEMPRSAVVRGISVWGGVLCMFVELDMTEPVVNRDFVAVSTQKALPENVEYVGMLKAEVSDGHKRGTMLMFLYEAKGPILEIPNV